jgi:D-alanyl-D-alanine carboxypeptidase
MLREDAPHHRARFHCGYAGTMAYLPSRKIAIAGSATVRHKAATSSNLSTDVLKDMAVYLAPESPS